MKQNLLKLIPYALILALTFYLLPCFIGDTGSGMIMLLILMPLIVFLTSAACGIFRGFLWILPLLCAALFLPTVWIYFNDSAWIYAVIYGVLALLGTGFGALFHKRK